MASKRVCLDKTVEVLDEIPELTVIQCQSWREWIFIEHGIFWHVKLYKEAPIRDLTIFRPKYVTYWESYILKDTALWQLKGLEA